mgnify:CR=1 FL=1
MWLLVSDNPHRSYAQIANLFYPTKRQFTEYISEQSCIADTAEIGEGCYISAGVYIGADVIIG